MEKYISSLENHKLNDAEIRLHNDVYKNWVVEENDMMGAEIRVAHHTKENCSRVSAYSLNDILDRNQALKTIGFFTTGDLSRTYDYTWVAISSGAVIKNNVLFSLKEGNKSRKMVEEILAKNCNALALGQRSTDCFLLKMLISGTMAGTIKSKVSNTNLPYSKVLLNDIFDICLKSWFGRHKSNNAMVIGTLNEEPTFDKLLHEDFIIDLFEVGLLID